MLARSPLVGGPCKRHNRRNPIDSAKIFIFGATHVGLRLARRLEERKLSVVVLDSFPTSPERPDGWLYLTGGFDSLPSLAEAELVFVVTDEDRLNIRLALAVRSSYPDVRIVVTLQQSRLGTKLVRHLDNFSFVSPPELAAKKFVSALDEPLAVPGGAAGIYESEPEPHRRRVWQIDPLVLRAVICFAVLALLTTMYFHFAENISWVDAWYFVVTLMTTVGFGDISLRESSSLSKIIGTLLMIASVTNTAILFALITDSLLRRRLAFSVGRRRVKYSGHVIVVGIGSVGMQVVRELLARGESVVIVEDDIHGRFLRAIYELRLPTIIGDAKLERTLLDAGLPLAKALISVTSDDLTNLEIGLNAKLLSPDARVVLRIYDYHLAQALDERLGIHFAFSSSAIAAEELRTFADAIG